MPELPFRDPFLTALAPRLAALAPRTRAVVAGLPPERLAQRPPAGGWSIAECLEHLVRGNGAYLDVIPAVTSAARGRAARPYAPSFFGRLLLGAIAESNPRRLPAPRKVQPLTVRDDVAAAFLATLERTAALAREADGADLCARLWSPIAPIPLRLGDAFDIVVTHAERHLGQAERVRRALGA